jgi:hypothetical protein
MTYNYNYAEYLGRELLKERRREAEHERLIRSLTPANPSILEKIWHILQSRWQDSRKERVGQQGYQPLSPLPKNSHSL